MIITLRPGVDVDALTKEHALKPSHTYRHALNGFAAHVNAETIQKLNHDPRVLAVEPDGRVVPCGQTVPAGILRMGITNFPVAHINGQDNRINVDVAVLDTGIQTNHPDLNVVQWADFTGEEWNGDDPIGHGTHVAGIIGALDNDFGVVGVAPGARLWSVRVLGSFSSTWSVVIAGCDYIATNADKIAVVNASFTGVSDSVSPYTAIHQAVSNLVSRGIVFVAAAGNGTVDISGGDRLYGTADDLLPAALPEVMAVSAMNPTNDTIAGFSNFSFEPKPWPASCPACTLACPGLGIDVAAPGVGILSTWIGSSYAMDDGTSMASAHAAGLAALYVAANGRAHSIEDVYRIRQSIIDHSQPQLAWHPPPCDTNSYCICTLDPDCNLEPLAFPNETWVPVPAILSGSMTPQGFQLSFPTVPGYTHTVLQTNFFSQSSPWAPLASTNGAGCLTTVIVTDPSPAAAMRLYRVMRAPTP